MSSDAHLEVGPVQLTRVEGKVDLVIQRLDDLVPRVARVELEVADLKSTTQRLTLEAVARDEKAVALAVALKAQKDAQEADDNKSWTPIQRLGGVVAVVLGALEIYQVISQHG